MKIEIRTAGMCKGTPDWQLDRAYETETAEALERFMNTEDDFPASVVVSQLKNADYYIGQALVNLGQAAALADPFGKAQEIDEIIEWTEDLRYAISCRREHLGGKR